MKDIKESLRNELQSLADQGDSILQPFVEYLRSPQEWGERNTSEPSLPINAYEAWYSASLAVVSQLAPDRLGDFIEHYKLPKAPADYSLAVYRLNDAIARRVVAWESAEDHTRATAFHLNGQVAIVKAVLPRLHSLLMDIRGTLQAELLDNELATAAELAKAKHLRSAGALAGVVLERHLREVCSNHTVNITKKKPTLSDFYEALKAQGVIDVPTWRKLQHLGDIRNLCAHDAEREPTKTEIEDMLRDVARFTKTLH